MEWAANGLPHGAFPLDDAWRSNGGFTLHAFVAKPAVYGCCSSGGASATGDDVCDPSVPACGDAAAAAGVGHEQSCRVGNAADRWILPSSACGIPARQWASAHCQHADEAKTDWAAVAGGKPAKNGTCSCRTG